MSEGVGPKKEEGLRGGRAALNQRSLGSRLRGGSGASNVASSLDNTEAEAVTSHGLFPIAFPREIPLNPWRDTRILEGALGTEPYSSGIGWVLLLWGDVLPRAGFTLSVQKTLPDWSRKKIRGGGLRARSEYRHTHTTPLQE